MKLRIQRRNVLELFLVIELLLPIISFFVFTMSGLFFNHNQLYQVCNVVYVILAFSYMRKMRRPVFLFFLSFFAILAISLIVYIRNLGVDGVFEFFRTISGYYIPIFLGFVIYKVYFERELLYRLFRCILWMAMFISIVNILHFILLQTDDIIHSEWAMRFNRYNVVVNYLYELNKTFYDYIVISANYNDVGFIRHVGYFFDTHSQYYMPLTGIIICLFGGVKFKNKMLYCSVFFLSILFSGIKTAYLSLIVIAFILLFSSGKFMLYSKKTFFIILLLLIFFKDKVLLLFGGEGMWKILIQLSSHLTALPQKILNYDFVTFLFGGVPGLRDDAAFYSEIFWVSLIFYIGVAGVFLYLKPINLFRYFKDKEFNCGSYMYLVLFLSLSHYSVYMVGINNLASALPFMYYFSILAQERRKNDVH